MGVGQLSESDAVDALRLPFYSSSHPTGSHGWRNQFDLGNPDLGQRPPFAPNHGRAPFLEPIHSGTGPPQPGENGPWSLCPSQTRTKEFNIHAINLPITLNKRANIVDPVGQLYVLKEEEDEVLFFECRLQERA